MLKRMQIIKFDVSLKSQEFNLKFFEGLSFSEKNLKKEHSLDMTYSEIYKRFACLESVWRQIRPHKLYYFLMGMTMGCYKTLLFIHFTFFCYTAFGFSLPRLPK